MKYERGDFSGGCEGEADGLRSSSASYLITFQGWSHQDDRPHGGNHVIRGDLLSLEGEGTHSYSQALI